jgi:PAS domain S-box-containing protein
MNAEMIDLNGESCTLTMLFDITERKQAEAALRKSEAKLSTILNSALAVIINFRVFAVAEWEFDYFSSGAELLYGYTPEQLMADKNLWVSRVMPEDWETIFLPAYQDIFAERTIQLEYRFFHKDGTVRWFSMTVFSQRDEAADCWVVTTVDIDISDRKQIEEQLKASLQEKEALLKEVHHRVKNNLQIISSLLDLQALQIQHPQALEAFQTAQNRVKSISLVHEKLYRSESLAQVNLADYIYNLTTHLIQTYTLNPDHITLQLRLDEVLSNLDTAIPCGLLINELVSNALKHGFPGTSGGSIWVELNTMDVVSPQNAQQVILIVGNNGIKLLEPSNLSEAESVGFQLIQALIQQIHGQMEIDESRGTEFRITFVNLGT